MVLLVRACGLNLLSLSKLLIEDVILIGCQLKFNHVLTLVLLICFYAIVLRPQLIYPLHMK